MLAIEALVPVGGLFFATAGVLRVVCYACKRHGQLVPRLASEGSPATPKPSILVLGYLIVLLVALLAPLALKVIKSVLLFDMTESPRDTVLALVDIGLSFSAVPFVCSFLGNELPQMWKSVTDLPSLAGPDT